MIGGPVIVYNYPKAFKAFYMRVNELEMDGDIARETVAALDILVPKVGELVGGSQREERMDVLEQRIIEMGLELGPYEWYLDLRRHGELLKPKRSKSGSARTLALQTRSCYALCCFASSFNEHS